ncbi:hypothetical protein CAPTEDRAFT_197070 [Capitella teleta]|uniref:RNA helicase n=1 Tax=Capitella teleta TaxID=283909 RepID=R7TEU6_CAPTE|nr:hypothetical protein CAPTEDRAFT_197070 [Capitella teleta]|eukprot:ELT92273.1 hypothetical protein CAPTEDRAFT_197070 [Capitella teleta]
MQLQMDRRRLPIFPAKKRFIQEITRVASAIVIGETGSGKTTQIPQYLLEAGVHKGRTIAVTQPRRVAAITVAQRVAKEVGCEIGEAVGYCVRFDDSSTGASKIRYSVVILDEAHERTIHTDVLFGVVKQAQKQRQMQGTLPLKVIVMSATMDVDHFAEYFNNAEVLYVEGRQFPVKLMYTREAISDYLHTALVTIFQIHQEAPASEDMLVFLTGQEEIEAMVDSIRDIARDLPSTCPALIACPMYAALPANLQLKIFQPVPAGTRKVIVCTNIAETSITIHGIKHVIDTGKVKAKVYNPSINLELLKVHNISQAQAWQRTGRAGREAPGICYRLYTEPEFHKMPENTIPEIQRCNLASVMLQLMALGVRDVVKFDFMDKPSESCLKDAKDCLQLLGALTKEERPKLTDLGRQMAAFPLDPRMAKVIISAKEHGCLEEILTIVAVLSVESVIFTPHNKREEAIGARRKFISHEGDHMTYLNIYRAFKAVDGNKHWCHDNFVNGRNLKTAMEVRRQLREICVRQELPLKSCGTDLSAVRQCFCAGFYMNSAELVADGKYVTLISRKPVAIHPSSALFQCKPGYVIYNELVKTTKCYMRRERISVS